MLLTLTVQQNITWSGTFLEYMANSEKVALLFGLVNSENLPESRNFMEIY